MADSSSGQLSVDDLDVSVEPDRTEARRRIGYVPSAVGHLAPSGGLEDRNP